ncbi:MAG: ATP phosphoribosyltransferase regulatory subunit [Actinobacteria bacterium]|nr:ATP phosphoribosyltransferase regulatory subunit [Actinomycetota bacterium]
MKSLTPFGVRDLVPEEAERLQKIFRKFKHIFEKWQYQKIITPSIEYYHTLEKGMGDSLKERSVKFFDASGQLVILRPDHTTPIARIVASSLTQEPMPLKLFYLDSVFRTQNEDHEQEMETFQAGVELIGRSGPEAEAEVLMICIEAILKLGYTDFGIDIGHTLFSESLTEDQKNALLIGDYVSFGDIPARGGVELVQDYPDLVKIHEILKSHNMDQYVTFNRGLCEEISYYTGVIFECYVKGIGKILGSGGRYDTLLGKFGFETPAVGFAFNVTHLFDHHYMKANL